MKRNFPTEKEDRFSGQLRHYHRSGAKPKRTWDEWVDGADAKPGRWFKWLKILGILVALIALAGVIAGLVNALR